MKAVGLIVCLGLLLGKLKFIELIFVCLVVVG